MRVSSLQPSLFAKVPSFSFGPICVSKAIIAFVALVMCTLPTLTEGHGHLTSPRSRNYEASQDGSWSRAPPGVPRKENCPHCLNTKRSNEVCGTSSSSRYNYDDWRDTRGNPIPWKPEATYVEGSEIIIESYISTNHAGHIDVFLCPDGARSTQNCFLSNPATMVQDLMDGGPNDPAWPGRGYLGLRSRRMFRFKYRLPMGVKGDQVMLQWRYVTANSCLPPGYVSSCYRDIILDVTSSYTNVNSSAINLLI